MALLDWTMRHLKSNTHWCVRDERLKSCVKEQYNKKKVDMCLISAVFWQKAQLTRSLHHSHSYTAWGVDLSLSLVLLSSLADKQMHADQKLPEGTYYSVRVSVSVLCMGGNFKLCLQWWIYFGFVYIHTETG